MLKIVLPDFSFADATEEKEVIASAGGDLVIQNALSPEATKEILKDADGIIVRWLPVDDNLLAAMPRCRAVVRYGVGVDNVDLDAATKRGIFVGYVPRYGVDEVSTHAIALMLCAHRQLHLRHEAVQRGLWDRKYFRAIKRLKGSTVGLVGFGNMGRAVARKLSGWGVRLCAVDPFACRAEFEALGVEKLAFEDVLAQADVVSLHLPLLEETRHLFNEKAFRLMRPGAILVNTARGGIVCERSLLEALESGKVGMAALDVFEGEPLPSTSPLTSHPGVVVSDHAAWYSEEALRDLKRTAAETVWELSSDRLVPAIANYGLVEASGRSAQWTPDATVAWRMARDKQIVEERKRSLPPGVELVSQ